MCVQSATLLTDQFNMDPDTRAVSAAMSRRPWSVVRIADTTTGKQANLFFEFPWQPPWSRGPQRDFASNRIYLSHGVTKRPHYCRVFSFLVKRMSFYDFLQSYVTQIYHTYTQMTQTGSRMTFVCHILSPTITTGSNKNRHRFTAISFLPPINGQCESIVIQDSHIRIRHPPMGQMYDSYTNGMIHGEGKNHKTII